MAKDTYILIDSEAKSDMWPELLDKLNKNAKKANEKTLKATKTAKNEQMTVKAGFWTKISRERADNGIPEHYIKPNKPPVSVPNPNKAFKTKQRSTMRDGLEDLLKDIKEMSKEDVEDWGFDDD